jgi:hypothetical protein
MPTPDDQRIVDARPSIVAFGHDTVRSGFGGHSYRSEQVDGTPLDHAIRHLQGSAERQAARRVPISSFTESLAGTYRRCENPDPTGLRVWLNLKESRIDCVRRLVVPGSPARKSTNMISYGPNAWGAEWRNIRRRAKVRLARLIRHATLMHAGT